MFTFVRSATAWAGRHAFPVLAGSMILAAGAGGGITYALSSHTAAAAATTPAASSKTTPAHKHDKGGAALSKALALLATDTGQSVSAIRTQLQAGKSVDQVAGPTAAAKYQADLLARLRTFLDGKVAGGKMTAAEESARLAKATTALSSLMAEPGTTLLQQAGQLQHFVHGHGGHAPRTPATVQPSPAA